MKKILILITILLGLTFADMIKDHAYVISAIGIKNINGEIAYISGSTNTPNADGSYNLVPQVIIYDGSTSYVGAATPFTGCVGDEYYFDSEKKGSCFMGGTMKGATSSANGESGLVPAPAAGQQSLFLRGDGTWAAPEGKNYSNATTSTSGLMSAADKTKLNGIASGANNYSLPQATSSTLGGVKIGSNISVSSGVISLSKANVTNALGYTPPSSSFSKAEILKIIYPVGSVYFSINNVNPSSSSVLGFGTWSQIGSKLVVSENVFGNGKTLGLTSGGTTLGGLISEAASNYHAYTGLFGANVGTTWSGNGLGSARGIGVPTKSQLGSTPSNSGLVVDTVTIYSWKRTA